MQFIILLYAGHCQQHSEVFFEFELALSLMPYAEMSRFFKTLLLIYFLPLSDSEYLLCSISLSLLALPVTLKKRKKKPKSDRSLFADVQFLGSELHGCLCNYDVVASSKGHLNCSWGFSCQGTKTYLKSTCVPCYEENQHPFSFHFLISRAPVVSLHWLLSVNPARRGIRVKILILIVDSVSCICNRRTFSSCQSKNETNWQQHKKKWQAVYIQQMWPFLAAVSFCVDAHPNKIH